MDPCGILREWDVIVAYPGGVASAFPCGQRGRASDTRHWRDGSLRAWPVGTRELWSLPSGSSHHRRDRRLTRWTEDYAETPEPRFFCQG